MDRKNDKMNVIHSVVYNFNEDSMDLCDYEEIKILLVIFIYDYLVMDCNNNYLYNFYNGFYEHY